MYAYNVLDQRAHATSKRYSELHNSIKDTIVQNSRFRNHFLFIIFSTRELSPVVTLFFVQEVDT
jgi:hypothetical protein